MPTTTLQHPMNEGRPYVPNPKWLIVVERQKVVRSSDLKTIRKFAHQTCAGSKVTLEGQNLTNAVSNILADAEKRLSSGSDIYILTNHKGGKLHFIRPSLSYQARVGHIRSVQREESNE